MTELIPVKHHWWTNFGEDGAWAWHWHLLKSGCIIPGHKWIKSKDTEEDPQTGFAIETGEYHYDCPKCGSYWGPYSDHEIH